MFVLIDAGLLSLAAAAGIASGYGLRYWRARQIAIAVEAAHQAEAAQEKARTKEMMQDLQDVAASVAAHVGEHNTRVQAINTELTTADAPGSESVMAAVAKLMEANSRMQEELESAEKKLEDKQREIESHASEARTDVLTQINNRRAFDEEMRKCQNKHRQNGRPTSVMMVDVDFFKKFNDTHGHKAGDEVLRHVARTMQQTVASTEVVCRYGGEEFTVIFPGSTLSAARAGAERARAAIGDCLIEFEGKSLQVNASAGLAEFLPDESVEDVLKRADEALYVSKKAGRNRGHFHDGHDFVPFVTPPAAVEKPAETPPTAPVAVKPPPVKEEPAPQKDSFTGLSNRTAFFDDLNRRVAEWKRGGSSLSVMFLQIDQFQQIASDHSDKALHVILRAATQFLKATMRDMDHLARYDDDTFSILLPTAELTNAVTIAERVRRAIARCKLPFKDGELAFTVSVGVAEAAQGDSTSRLLQRAKVALDMSSAAGGDRTCFHDGSQCTPAGQLAAVKV